MSAQLLGCGDGVRNSPRAVYNKQSETIDRLFTISNLSNIFRMQVSLALTYLKRSSSYLKVEDIPMINCFDILCLRPF